jgi:hypothetical protein
VLVNAMHALDNFAEGGDPGSHQNK